MAIGPTGTDNPQSALDSARDSTPTPLQMRVADLHNNYGQAAVTREALKLSVQWVEQDSAEILQALASEQPSNLLTLRPQVISLLITIVQSESAKEVEELIKRILGDDASHHMALLQIWLSARPQLETLMQVLPRDTGTVPLTEEYLDQLRKQLELSAPQASERLAQSVALYQDTLLTLQRQLLEGRDITRVLTSLGDDALFNDMMVALAQAQLNDRSKASTEPDLVTYVAQYSALIRRWRSFRLAKQGRVNHPVALIRETTFYDFQYNAPCAEIHINAPDGEIFHVRDQVDDILQIAASFIEITAGAIHDSLPISHSMDPDFVDAIASIYSRLSRGMVKLGDALKNLDETRQAQRGTN